EFEGFARLVTNQLQQLLENELNLNRKIEAIENSSKLIVDAMKGIHEHKNKSDNAWKTIVEKKSNAGIRHKKCLIDPQSHKQKCYYFIKSELQFMEALDLCKNMNATLVSIQSDQERNFITKNLLHNDVYWTAGVQLLYSVNEYLWVDGSKVYEKFFANILRDKQQRNQYNSNCVAIKNGVLIKKNCDSYLSVVCQEKGSSVQGDTLIDMHSQNLQRLQETIENIKSDMYLLKERDVRIIDVLNKMFLHISLKENGDDKSASTVSENISNDITEYQNSNAIPLMRGKRSISNQNRINYGSTLKSLQNENLKLHESLFYLKITGLSFFAFFVIFVMIVTQMIRNVNKKVY
ncbi:killer cell lectin-like receptor subfamily F member 1 isoform X6, partial [Leptotrombidium deliense]